jgi:hypothetical protein
VKQRGLRRAAVTNSPRLNAEQVIAALKIPDFFDTIVVGSECDNPKPSPDPYLKAIKFLGVEASQCFVLEVTRALLSCILALRTMVSESFFPIYFKIELTDEPRFDLHLFAGFPIGR